MVNVATVAGRLTRDPELRYTPSGKPVANMTVACDRDSANAQGERETDFFDCVLWGKQAENAANTLTKGRLVAVTGRLQTRSYETSEGQRRKVTEIWVNRWWYMDRKPKDEDSMGEEVGEVPFA